MNYEKNFRGFEIPFMMLTCIFGFNQIMRGYYFMGYQAIFWFILAAVVFFIPFSFMMSEFSFSFKNHNGIYDWMQNLIGSRWAFIVTFLWYTSYLIWMVNTAFMIWAPLPGLFSSSQERFEMLGISNAQLFGILGWTFFLIIFIITSRGLKSIMRATLIGGIINIILNVMIFLIGITILIVNKWEALYEIKHFVLPSFNIDFQGIVPMLSFFTLTILAFGGIETVISFVSQVEGSIEKIFKWFIGSILVIPLLYIIGIFAVESVVDWNSVLANSEVNSGNFIYIVIKNLGYELGMALGFRESTCLQVGMFLMRYVGVSMFISLSAAMVIFSYAPLKQLIEGTPRQIWPKSFVRYQRGTPISAMAFQTVVCIVLILTVSFGGNAATYLFDKLLLMTGISGAIPTIFLVSSFIIFRFIKKEGRTFVIYKNKWFTLMISIVAICAITFASLFTIINPLLNHDYQTFGWIVSGPIFFGVISNLIYSRYQRTYVNRFKNKR